MAIDLTEKPEIVEKIRANFLDALSGNSPETARPELPEELSELFATLYTEAFLEANGVARPKVDLAKLAEAHHRM